MAVSHHNVTTARSQQDTHVLDKVAYALVGVSVAFVSLIAHSPFSLGLLAGAAYLAVYGFLKREYQLMAIAAFLPSFGLLAWGVTYLVYLITPHTLDGLFLRIDGGVGVAVWHWTTAHAPVFDILWLTYYGLGLPAGIAIALSPRRSELLRACVIGAIAATTCCYFFPAVGPKWIGHEAARNCMPSMHFTWALLLYIYCRRWPFAVFAALTAWATMGLGEHYAIDLVAALPFTAAVCYAARLRLPSSSYRSTTPEPYAFPRQLP